MATRTHGFESNFFVGAAGAFCHVVRGSRFAFIFCAPAGILLNAVERCIPHHFKETFMKAARYLLAVTALAGAVAANAATVASFDITLVNNYALGPYSSSGDGDGAAVLDGSGVLTVQTTEHDLIYYSGFADPVFDLVIGKTNIYNGTFDGVTFTPTSGWLTNVSCFDNFTQAACAGLLPLDTLYPFLAISGQISVSGGGVLEGSFPTVDNGVNYLTTTFTPSVPVPAAAWLFGSGLLGLAGVRRKSKAA